MINNVLCVVAALAGAVFMAVMLFNAVIGCGEPIYHADGTYVTGECLFVDYEPVTGRWR
jgi:hypothetical protein